MQKEVEPGDTVLQTEMFLQEDEQSSGFQQQ